ncbi:MAG: hypothetical protein GY789_23610 [Hyphomicrobiales bacterium]|nr:hypothetical protein [Hyphomicrobiales bacterium]
MANGVSFFTICYSNGKVASNMKIGRRKVIKGGACLAVSSLVGSPVMALERIEINEFSSTHDVLKTSLFDHFSQLGYTRADHMPLITNDYDINGGLRYHGVVSGYLPGDLVVQPISRLDDLADKDRPDNLPLFHVFLCRRLPGSTFETVFSQLLNYLTEGLNLEISRLLLVSIPGL